MTVSAKAETDVLIIGAGPTGLVLALWLTHLGIRVRIIDKTGEPGTTSRALAVQARESILESYEPERIAFARRLVKTTDQALPPLPAADPSQGMCGSTPLRPCCLCFFVQADAPVLYRAVSQTDVNYRRSLLSVGQVGSVHGGDRLPWVKTTGRQ